MMDKVQKPSNSEKHKRSYSAICDQILLAKSEGYPIYLVYSLSNTVAEFSVEMNAEKT
jgi:hypothetical protein